MTPAREDPDVAMLEGGPSDGKEHPIERDTAE
jgi:hypothetical protein